MTTIKHTDPALRMSRRALIRALGALGIGAIAAACRPDPSGPTPTPTRTARPLTSTPTASATWPVPSATSTATATGTPEPTLPPTATPTPPPTPFPPGPPTKLGLFITRNDPRIFELLATRNVALVKTMEYDPNFATDIKRVSPNTLLVGRIDLPQIDLSGLTDPRAAAQRFADQLLPIATEPRRLAAFDGWESYNEPSPSDPEQMLRYAEFEAHRTRLLAAAGVRSVVGNFSTGMPPLEWWPQFRPALEAAIEHRGFLGLHEYSAPTMQYGTPQELLGWGSDPAQEGWLTLRYRKVYRGYLQPNNLALPLLLTEVGIDGYIGDHPGPVGMGWKDFARFWAELGMGEDAAGNYMELLAWYDTQLQQDPYVLGAAIFAAAASPGWETYEVLDEVFPFLKQYLSVHPPR
ncbi:MAG: hypothetical protein ACUVR4_02890 [Anaerolineae bacterium]